MFNIRRMIEDLNNANAFKIDANDPTLQFENQGEGYLFSEFLPERLVPQNMYREESIEFRSMIANSSTRYAPPTKKDAALIGSLQVELSESDAATGLEGQPYEQLLLALNDNRTMEAEFQVLQFFNRGVSGALATLREKERVDMISRGYFERKGADDLYEICRLPDFPGHRVTVPSGPKPADGATSTTTGSWYNPATDILAQIKAKKMMLLGKGYQVNRIITTPEIYNNALLINTGILKYGLSSLIGPGGTAITMPRISESETINAAMRGIGVPTPEIYDAGYSDQERYQKFMGQYFIMICTTRRNGNVDLGYGKRLIVPNTLGYYAIGRAAMQLAPGIPTHVEVRKGKLESIYAEAWQTTFPVVQSPEAIVAFEIPIPV